MERVSFQALHPSNNPLWKYRDKMPHARRFAAREPSKKEKGKHRSSREKPSLSVHIKNMVDEAVEKARERGCSNTQIVEAARNAAMRASAGLSSRLSTRPSSRVPVSRQGGVVVSKSHVIPRRPSVARASKSKSTKGRAGLTQRLRMPLRSMWSKGAEKQDPWEPPICRMDPGTNMRVMLSGSAAVNSFLFKDTFDAAIPESGDAKFCADHDAIVRFEHVKGSTILENLPTYRASEDAKEYYFYSKADTVFSMEEIFPDAHASHGVPYDLAHAGRVCLPIPDGVNEHLQRKTR